MGFRVPSQAVTLSDGKSVCLDDFYAERPAFFVFLRHLGCPFCREQVDRLALSPKLNIVFVAPAGPVAVEKFKKKFRATQPFICDPQLELYRAFGLEKTSVLDIVSPQVFAKGIGAALRGHWIGVPIGDIRQMPGVFCVEPGGQVTWEYRSNSIFDVANLDDIDSSTDDES